MRLRWTIPAAEDLENIYVYLSRNHPRFAESTVRSVLRRIQLLKASPDAGRAGHRHGTREFVLSPLPYVVVYRVQGDSIEILHIFHGAQDWR